MANIREAEVEKIMGFPTDHTRKAGIPRSKIFEALGNSFQVRMRFRGRHFRRQQYVRITSCVHR